MNFEEEEREIKENIEAYIDAKGTLIAIKDTLVNSTPRPGTCWTNTRYN